jgi:hypothetical protein
MNEQGKSDGPVRLLSTARLQIALSRLRHDRPLFRQSPSETRHEETRYKSGNAAPNAQR